MTVRVGFLGAGFISRFHVVALATCGVDNEIVAVHDPDPERAQAFAAAHGGRVVGEDELFELVDAVYVTTWTSEHPAWSSRRPPLGWPCSARSRWPSTPPPSNAWSPRSRPRASSTRSVWCCASCPRSAGCGTLIGDPRAGRVLAAVFRDDQYIPDQGIYGSTWRTGWRAGRARCSSTRSTTSTSCTGCSGPSARWRDGRLVHGHPRIDDVTVARLDFAGGAAATLTSVWRDVLERGSLRRLEVLCERLFVARRATSPGRCGGGSRARTSRCSKVATWRWRWPRRATRPPPTRPPPSCGRAGWRRGVARARRSAAGPPGGRCHLRIGSRRGDVVHPDQA